MMGGTGDPTLPRPASRATRAIRSREPTSIMTPRTSRSPPASTRASGAGALHATWIRPTTPISRASHVTCTIRTVWTTSTPNGRATPTTVICVTLVIRAERPSDVGPGCLDRQRLEAEDHLECRESGDQEDDSPVREGCPQAGLRLPPRPVRTAANTRRTGSFPPSSTSAIFGRMNGQRGNVIPASWNARFG
jgi:hypothetical protein